MKSNHQIKELPSYLPELDILRFLAFFAIFVHHSLPYKIESYQGRLAPFADLIANSVLASRFSLDVFFSLSAFLITRLLIKENRDTGRIDAKSFYLRRALRIFPLYYFSLFLVIFILPPSLAGEPLNFFHTIGFLSFAANWSSAFLGLPDSSIAALWSVSIEEQFYLAFPLLVMLFGVKRLKLLAVIFLVIASATRFLLVFNEASVNMIGCNTFVRLDSIAVGILLAVMVNEGKIKPISQTSIRLLLLTASLVGYFMAATYLDWSGIGALFLYPVSALLSGIVIWISLSYKSLKAIFFLPFIFFGRISYGLYVFHLIALRLAVSAYFQFSIPDRFFTLWRFTVALTITTLMGILSYKYLERPFLKMKRHFSRAEAVSVQNRFNDIADTEKADLYDNSTIPRNNF